MSEAAQERQFPDLELQKAESLGEAIRQAVGNASTCWDNLEGAGVFQSERAINVAEQLEKFVNDYFQDRKVEVTAHAK